MPLSNLMACLVSALVKLKVVVLSLLMEQTTAPFKGLENQFLSDGEDRFTRQQD